MAPASHVPRLGLRQHAGQPRCRGPDGRLGGRRAARKGIGRSLVQSAAALLVRRDIRALEAIGTYHDGPSCMVPAGWLSVGFALVRPHPVTPRFRMNLQTTVRWRPDLGAAWHRLRSGRPTNPAGTGHPSPTKRELTPGPRA